MDLIRTGILGFGSSAERCHLKALWECGRYEVVGVCDVTARRRTLAEELALDATDDLDELLSWDIELVVVATHSARHYEDAIHALRAGKHVLVETPMARTAQQAQDMVAVAQQCGRALMVFHNYHYEPDYRMVKAALCEGLLGRVLTLERHTANCRPAVCLGAPEYNPAWRITASAGGGTLLDYGPHGIEQMLDLTEGRKVVRVFADVRHAVWGDVDDLFHVDLILDDGTRAAVSKCDFAYVPPADKWLIYGTQATLHGPVTTDGQRRVVICGTDWELKRAVSTEVVSLYVNLADHIRDGKDLVIPPQHALRVMQVLQAALDSAAARRSVEVCI